MSRKDGELFIIEDEPDRECQFCGKEAETRPYGLGGKRICYECAMLPENKSTVEENFGRVLRGEEPQ
jgi:hypothetical protein